MRVRLLITSAILGGALVFGTFAATAQKKHDHSATGDKHNHPTAQTGGVLEDVGEFHAELAVKDGKIQLTLRDHEAKDATTEGMKATVLITAGSQRIGPVELKSAGTNKMEGPVAAVPAGATAILTLTEKDGTAAQGRFKLK